MKTKKVNKRQQRFGKNRDGQSIQKDKEEHGRIGKIKDNKQSKTRKYIL